jgi:hypothetical protein
MGTLPHAEEPEGTRRRSGRLLDADAVVLDLQDDRAALLGQADIDARRPGVPRDVRQRLLQDPKKGRRLLSADHQVGWGSDPAGYRRPALELFHLPLQGRRKAKVVQHAGPQLGGDPPHLLDRLVGQARHFFGLVDHGRQRVGFLPLEPGRHPGQVHLQARQTLAELVVDLARDAGAFLLAHAGQLEREEAQLFARPPQLGVGPLAFGHVPHQGDGPHTIGLADGVDHVLEFDGVALGQRQACLALRRRQGALAANLKLPPQAALGRRIDRVQQVGQRAGGGGFLREELLQGAVEVQDAVALRHQGALTEVALRRQQAQIDFSAHLEMIFEASALRDVPSRPDDAGRPMVGDAGDRAAIEHRAHLSIRAKQAMFKFEGLPVTRLADRPPYGLAVFGGDPAQIAFDRRLETIRVEVEDAKHLGRPGHAAGFHVPLPASDLGQAFCLVDSLLADAKIFIQLAYPLISSAEGPIHQGQNKLKGAANRLIAGQVLRTWSVGPARVRGRPTVR